MHVELELPVVEFVHAVHGQKLLTEVLIGVQDAGILELVRDVYQQRQFSRVRPEQRVVLNLLCGHAVRWILDYHLRHEIKGFRLVVKARQVDVPVEDLDVPLVGLVAKRVRPHGEDVVDDQPSREHVDRLGLPLAAKHFWGSPANGADRPRTGHKGIRRPIRLQPSGETDVTDLDLLRSEIHTKIGGHGVQEVDQHGERDRSSTVPHSPVHATLAGEGNEPEPRFFSSLPSSAAHSAVSGPCGQLPPREG